ncbi:hypothetical protein QCN38_gp85 [Arthrobacter phage Trustiboi]|uniref:Uncharacterized protein n=1 Tax=Arthrobacter phage Trustiboi TaxID=2951391 RepID=A0A9E7NEU3_9CAUD|nr:hypothetical protein QCN38_gp85 [Arthrobacter phage Trustiboi]UTN91645.1 hypothetical protein SEA_TRUSTIBOI_85 [Arthrobacter phage Trustiboi]
MKGRVPEEHLREYRRLRAIYEPLDRVAHNMLNHVLLTNDDSLEYVMLYQIANKYREQAQALRVDLPKKEDV